MNHCSEFFDIGAPERDTSEVDLPCSPSVVFAKENEVVKPPSEQSAQRLFQATLSGAAPGDLARRGQRVSRTGVRGDRPARHRGSRRPFARKPLPLLPRQRRNSLLL